MTVRGLLYVDARFTNPELSVEAFDKWYDEEHIPHLLTMSGCHAAMRFVDIDAKAEIPFLTLYLLKDVFWVHSAEFGTSIVSTESDLLPGRSVFKSVAFDVRSYTLVESIVGEGAEYGDTAYVILTAMRADTESPAGPGEKVDLRSSAIQRRFKQAYRYHMHEGQPEEWKQRWQSMGNPGGWPERDLVIQRFDGSQTEKQLASMAREIDDAEWTRSWLSVSSRVYKLTKSFGSNLGN
ncbi:MAG: hypothetical protein M1830_007424 [Pleopsidium flavum]|nr:MAG: hypothetical protein M1830_007424 [Pleopsidium flavum]